jgi:hypothetical protein
MTYEDTPTTPVRKVAPNTLNQLVGAVGEDPGLTSSEKETIIRWANPDEMAHIYSRQAGVIRRLLQHRLYEVKELGLYDGSPKTATLDEATGSAGRVTAIWGFLPIGALKVQSSSRSSSAAHKVVSKQNRRSLQAGESHEPVGR